METKLLNYLNGGLWLKFCGRCFACGAVYCLIGVASTLLLKSPRIYLGGWSKFGPWLFEATGIWCVLTGCGILDTLVEGTFGFLIAFERGLIFSLFVCSLLGGSRVPIERDCDNGLVSLASFSFNSIFNFSASSICLLNSSICSFFFFLICNRCQAFWDGHLGRSTHHIVIDNPYKKLAKDSLNWFETASCIWFKSLTLTSKSSNPSAMSLNFFTISGQSMGRLSGSTG